MRPQARELLLLLAGVVLVQASVRRPGDVPDEVDAPVEIHPEEPCSHEGGICGLESACPTYARHPVRGLCPSQKGAECCYAVPDNEVNCRRRGGECMAASACGRAPRELRGQCPEGEVCCVLLF